MFSIFPGVEEMEYIRKILPQPVKNHIKSILIWVVRLRHVQELKRVKKKERIKVVFLAIHESMWKVDAVFRKMLDDPFFDPMILVCPHVEYGNEAMVEDMEKAYNYFSRKSYPVISSYDKASGSWLRVEDLKPDMVFFTRPYRHTRPEYYENAFYKYLTCYVPYFYLATSHISEEYMFNTHFHNAMWKIFMPHQHSMDRAKKVSDNNATNCVLTGYPSCESLLVKNEGKKGVWKEQVCGKKKIIFAPHHSIGTASGLSNFIEYAEFMVELSTRYRNETQWSFKPHPVLKPKLYRHPDWGKEKADKYFSYWAFSENTQLDEGEYSELFVQSDAIIHDSSSFIVEYLFVEKPCLYLVRDKQQAGLKNKFGLKALKAYDLAREKSDIENFLISVINGDCSVKANHKQFLLDEVEPLYCHDSPSDKILRTLKDAISAGK
ncbi:CDP-glycerol glycerophosphotransferase family protein [Halomonas sp. M5N1S17]|uniref:CDP-glycerol glycerophosphotransferase family protein n=1 Tax=Halomonas alkalisoli TaxID=2907158 RepID=UPI001F47D45C|nr:CDP-glycerol glycerophosphotransferase family protein [Halomonas alkalisoli]MCE9664009.1 CDP-glycerol glycerophosphotransferase family protein [Halomonas alkalisoli]